MDNKINVGIIFGGQSGEHEVSLQSAKSIYDAIDKDKYNVTLIGIDKDGRWLLGERSEMLLNETNPKLIALNRKTTTQVTPLNANNTVVLQPRDTQQQAQSIEVFFNIIHGTTGEDGALQGMLEIMNVAYVGAGVLGSAVGMDKDVMKRLLRDAGLPVAHFATLKRGYDPDNLKQIISTLEYPVFVKPANTGSSVGVNKAHDEKELQRYIDEAFQYDHKILIEEYIKAREIECSILGNDHPQASVCGEVIPRHEFYSYEAKYIDENGAALEIPANISDLQMKHIQNLAIQAFQALECKGFARVDTFLTEDGEVYVNEINTLPGFTKISMYPKLWEASGLPYPKLIDKLIELALEEKHKKDRLKRSYS